ncbi:MAG TPA: metallophosphoesterase [Cellvibrio sp.]|nr:metallophosphoesterase [Cellvibrio sp.]
MSSRQSRPVGRFFLVVSTLVGLLHIYIALRLLPALAAPLWLYFIALGWLIFSAAAIPLAMLARFFVKRQALADALAWVGLSAMGFFSSLLVLTLLRDLLLPIAYLLVSEQTFAQLVVFSARAVVSLAGAATLIGFINVRRTPAIVHIDIPLAGLPPVLQNFTLVQISDVHIGPTIKGAYLQAIVDQVNSLNPDLVAITGDLVDGSVAQLREQVAPLKNLRSRYGNYFVTGNHEYYSGAEAWINYIKSLGIEVLLNQHIVLYHNRAPLVLAGVTDYNAQQIVFAHKSDPAAALAGAQSLDAVKILLAHQPRSAAAASAAGFDLQLSGHTHGGQFWPWNFFVPLQQPYTVGLHKLNKMWIYINRGTGYWGPPKRLGGRGEISCIRLVKQENP